MVKYKHIKFAYLNSDCYLLTGYKLHWNKLLYSSYWSSFLRFTFAFNSNNILWHGDNSVYSIINSKKMAIKLYDRSIVRNNLMKLWIIFLSSINLVSIIIACDASIFKDTELMFG